MAGWLPPAGGPYSGPLCIREGERLVNWCFETGLSFSRLLKSKKKERAHTTKYHRRVFMLTPVGETKLGEGVAKWVWEPGKGDFIAKVGSGESIFESTWDVVSCTLLINCLVHRLLFLSM